MSSLRIALRRMAKLGLAVAEAPFGRLEGPRILIYHQVGAGLEREMEVTEGAFRRQLDLLEHRRVVSLDAALAEAESPQADEMVVLTFDDGYRDVFELAYPLLQEHGMPFVLYLATESIETGEPLGPRGGADPLTWEQIESMLAGGGLTVGAHTHTHLDLRGVSRGRVEHEIGVSNELIERRLGVTPRHFAYPWGYWDPDAHEIVARVYDSATLGGGAPVGPDTNPFEVNRIPIQLSDGVLGFRAKLRTGGRLEERLRRRVTGYTGP